MAVETQPEVLGITDPVAVRLDAPVACIYPLSDGTPDTTTWIGHADYLASRAANQIPTQANGAAAVRMLPQPVETTRFERTGWLMPRKWAAALALGAALVANASSMVSLLKDAGEAAKGAWYNVTQLWGGGKQHILQEKQVVTPGSEVKMHAVYGPIHSGRTAPDAADVSDLLAVIKQETDQGEARWITLQGKASAEYGGPDSLTVANEQNEKIAARRAQAFKTDLQAAAEGAGIELPSIRIEGREDTMTSAEAAALTAAIQKYGYTFRDAIGVYKKAPHQLPAALRATLDQAIGSERHVAATVAVRRNPVVQSIFSYKEIAELPPVNKNQPYNPQLWPLLALVPALIPRGHFERRTDVRNVPTVIEHNVPPHAWVKLYPEALTATGQLTPAAWFYTRKYQILLRDDRVHSVLRHDYTDRSSERQTLRMIFIDHEPSARLQNAYSDLMANISRSDAADGKVPIIAVYPSRKRGLAARRPASLGLGIDEVYDHATAVTVPVLGMTELHAPDRPEELYRTLARSFCYTPSIVSAEAPDDTTYSSLYEDPDLGPLALAARRTPLSPEDRLITVLVSQTGAA